MTSINQGELLTIHNMWSQYVSGKSDDCDLPRTEIAEAWQRCHAHGVNPHEGRSYDVLSSDDLMSALDRHTEFIDVARPFMDKLHEFVAGSGFIVLLTDERGYVLSVTGDIEIMENAGELNISPGACWSEEEIGNNGVGTALVLKKPVQVSGAEHYCQKHHPWTCSGAPIFDDNNDMIGILEMSGPVEKAHLHTLGMVVAAAEAIREQLNIRKTNRELTLLNNRLQNIYNTVTEGIMIINHEGRVTQVNPAIEKILQRSGKDLEGVSIVDLFERTTAIQELLSTGKGFSDIEIVMDTDGVVVHCLASGQPVRDDLGHIDGGVIFINPLNRIKNLVNRLSGAQASLKFEDIIGDSHELKRAVRLASLAASSESNVLLEGESGTGKEIFAQAIHNASSRRDNPFIAVNCGAIPRELLGSELFGYVEGAFTGAKKGGRPGKFELAHGGTIFLDEIGEMPLGKQVSLLRVLQERTVTRIGGDKVIPVDVRVICASNRNLQDEVRKGNFRRDLYYRLNVIDIVLPPLRNRREDIALLFQHFLQYVGGKSGLTVPGVDPDVIYYLEQYPWPGNVRELQNVAERLINITGGNKIEVEHLPTEILNPSPDYVDIDSEWGSSLEDERSRRKQYLAKKEREELIALLGTHGGNVSLVAKTLGVSRNTVYRKMRQYNII
ncbi:MAG: sigma-54-dependent Fis family transcriptional regulator [Chitinophagales bacterium]